MKNTGISLTTLLQQKAEQLLLNRIIPVNTPSSDDTDPQDMNHETEVFNAGFELHQEKLDYSDIIIELDKHGTVMHINRALNGYTLEESIGKNFCEWTLPEYHALMKHSLKQAFKTFIPQTYLSIGTDNLGNTRWFRSSISSPSENKKVKTAVLVLQDITDRSRNENTIKGAIQNQQTVVETAMDGFCLVDIKGRILEANETYCRMSGYSKKELTTMFISDIEVIDTKTEIDSRIQSIIASGEGRFETVHRRKDGGTFQVEVSTHYLSDFGGRFITFIHDITEKKHAEESLRDSEARYKSLFQDNQSVLLLINPDTAEITDANPAACHYYGWSHTEMCQKTLFEDNPLSEEIIKKSLQKAKEEKCNHFFFKHRLANDELHYVELYSGPIKFGETILLYAIIHDITEIELAKKALRINEEQYALIYNSSRDGIFSLDMLGIITGANRSFCNELKLDLPQVIGHTFNEVGVPDYITQEIERLIGVVIESNNSILIEQKVVLANGGILYYELIINPLHDENENIVGFGGSCRNITKRKKAEVALKKLNEELEVRVNERTYELYKSNEALKITEVKYRTVSDFATNWEFWIALDDSMIYCSPSCERITGYSSAEFIENSQLIYTIIHPDDLPVYLEHKKEESKVHEADHEIQYRIFKKDGTIRWIGHFCQSVFDESGNLNGIRGSNKDITARKKMEELLATSNQKYKLLSENINDGIFICRKGRLEYINSAFYTIFGYNGQEMERMKLTQLVLTDHNERLEKILYSEDSFNKSCSIEVECLRKDCTVIFVEILLNYVANDKTVYGVVHDITEKKEFQKHILKAIIQTEENERTIFSKELHDGLGPLLSTIKIYLQWSERPNNNKSREEIIGKAGEILEEALWTVKEISNRLSPHLLTYYGLNSAIKSYVEKLKVTESPKIVFESNAFRRIGTEKEASLYRALIECINNTLKHAHALNIFIQLEDSGTKILMHYKDDGKGYDMPAILSKQKGLGLFNLQNRLQTIGGKVELFSEPGKGVSYLFTINI